MHIASKKLFSRLIVRVLFQNEIKQVKWTKGFLNWTWKKYDENILTRHFVMSTKIVLECNYFFPFSHNIFLTMNQRIYAATFFSSKKYFVRFSLSLVLSLGVTHSAMNRYALKWCFNRSTNAHCFDIWHASKNKFLYLDLSFCPSLSVVVYFVNDERISLPSSH